MMARSTYNRVAPFVTVCLVISALAVQAAPASARLTAPAAPAAPLAAPSVSAPTLIAGAVGNQMNPSMVGDTLVYDDCPLPYLPCTLSAYDFKTQSSYQVATGVEYLDFQGAVQRTDGASVVWTDAAQKALRIAGLSDNSARDLPATPATRRETAVWDNIVVWTDGRNSPPNSPLNNDIYMLDTTSGKEKAVSTNEADASHPASNGKVIVWQDSRRAGASSFNTDIYGYNIATGKEFVIANTANSELTPSISGNTVVWVSQDIKNNSSIVTYDLQTQRTTTIARTTPPAEEGAFVNFRDPAIWGNIVLWVRSEYPPGPGFPDSTGIYGYDLASKQAFTVVDDTASIRYSPTVAGNRIVWVEYSKSSFTDGRSDIMGATLSGVNVAQVSTPAPKPAPTSRTFTETGKTVSGRFLDYWFKHGGLPQQGYPISEPMNEVSDLDGKTYQVQYFERAVFEMHPENKPPYDVLLSQLGTFRYKAQHPTPPQPAPALGTIKGRLSYPSEGVPSLAIFAIPVDGSKGYHSVLTWYNSTTYAIEGVAPGTYYVAAYINDSFDGVLNMAYTKAAQCQQADPNATNCDDHSLIAVKVSAGETVENVSPTDYGTDIKFPPRPAGSPEAGMCQTFKETGQLLCGAFLQYWYAHGGLAQQGYPISASATETSDLDSKTYQVQYFERAVFEMHPENKPPYDVLLSQLGTFRYKAKYQP